MTSILIRCPKTGKVVPTGLDADKIKFEALTGIQFALVCLCLRHNSSLDKIQSVA